MGDSSGFQRRHIVGAFSWSICEKKNKKKTATLLGVSRATVSEVMSTYKNHEKTASSKRSSGRTSALTERDLRT
jgi:predicted transcriptional regulator